MNGAKASRCQKITVKYTGLLCNKTHNFKSYSVYNNTRERQCIDIANRKAELARSLLQGQEESKRRFSHYLHDRTSANLAALRLNLDIIIATATNSRDTQEFSDCVADTGALLEDTNAGIRDICADLYPNLFELGGLLIAMQSYAQSINRRTGLEVNIECADNKTRLTMDMELALFRIVQEALTNCTKHACAQKITVSLQLTVWPIKLSISDDGAGFKPQTTCCLDKNGLTSGQGLRQMRQTTEFLNGRFWLESALGQGTHIRIEIPEPTWKLQL